MYDYLIIGSGLAGSTLAERLANKGYKVLIADKRSHIGGNCYDEYNNEGILVHKYGPHSFHTNSKEVWEYLSKFTEWYPYEARSRASVDGLLVPIPINLDTINTLYNMSLTPSEMKEYLDSVKENRPKHSSEDAVVGKVGLDLYNKFFKQYTIKQWGLDPSELDYSVCARIPVRFNRDDRYFTDEFQGTPLYGYTRMFEKMLDNKNIHIMLNTSFEDIKNIPHKRLIYTGPIDSYFNYSLGKLPYRSLNFVSKTYDVEYFQKYPVINHPNNHPYTRSSEYKYITGQNHKKTTVIYEYPTAEGDPFYPIPRPENKELYKQYEELAKNETNVFFAGRLGTYNYLNMDQCVAASLKLFSELEGLSNWKDSF